jgi:RNA polymerase sigma-32 factor
MKVNSGNHFDLRRCVPMSREEEHRCALEYVRTRDPVLAERLIVANMRMVVAQAHHHCRTEGDLRDMVQEGNRGLLRALEKFDPTRGLKFCTYAVWWIRAYMLKFSMDNWRLVKVGTTQAQRKLFFSLRKERERLERTGAAADTRALASRLRVKESEVVAMLDRFAGGEMSLDAPTRSQDSDAPTLSDLLSDVSTPGPDRRVEEAEFSRILQAKLEQFAAGLRGREAQIFRRRLLTDEPMKLAELASAFGVSRERTRQLELRLKARIRDYLQEELGDAFALPAAKRRRDQTIAPSMPNSPMPRLERPIVLQRLQ